MKLNKQNIYLQVVLIIVASGCREVPVPKPKGYFRIDLPKKEYVIFEPGSDKRYPFTFEYPVYGKLSFDNKEFTEPGWFNIEFPAFDAKVYFTYKRINNDLESLMEQTYQMNVKNHIIKAEAINEKAFNNPANEVYGIFYDLKGNTATSVQFYATDSIKHYLRGSLYFAAEPNADSIAPVRDFLREDVIHLIETLKWKEE